MFYFIYVNHEQNGINNYYLLIFYCFVPLPLSLLFRPNKVDTLIPVSARMPWWTPLKIFIIAKKKIISSLSHNFVHVMYFVLQRRPRFRS